MLPKDARRPCDTTAANKQTHLDPHLKEEPLKERVTPYTDSLFCNTAIVVDFYRPGQWHVLQICDRLVTCY